jgi:acyl-CoA thioesterase
MRDSTVVRHLSRFMPLGSRRSCSIEYVAPAHAGDVVTATAVERAVVGRGGTYDVAVTRDGDGRLLAARRGQSRQPEAPPGTG